MGPEDGCGWFAHRFGGGVCTFHFTAYMHSTLLLLAVQKWQLGFLVFLYLVVHNLPQPGIHAVIFTPS